MNATRTIFSMEIMDFDNVDVDKIHVHKYLLVSTYKDWRRYSRQYGLNTVEKGYGHPSVRSSVHPTVQSLKLKNGCSSDEES